MPPATSIPRETRAQRRKSRAGSDGAESIEAPSSTTRKAPTPRRKPNVGPKPSSNYGATIDSQAPAQKQAAILAKRVATDRIEAGVGAAIERSATVTTNTKGLTAVPEEDNREDVGDDDISSREEEWMAFNSRGGESGRMDYHHTASDLAGSKILGSQAYLNAFPNRQSSRVIAQQSTALNQAATSPNRDAIFTQPVYQSQRDMPPPPPAVQTSIQHPTLTNSFATTVPFSRGETATPGIWRWMFMALIISVIVSLSSAVLSTVRYHQITTSLSDFQNGGHKVSSIIPTMFGQRLDKLEEQVAHLAEIAVLKDSRSHQINWFSFDLGARANPYLSSPYTRRPNLKIKGRWSLKWKDIRSAWKSSQQLEHLPPPPPPPLLCKGDGLGSNTINPNAALTPYSEFEPRYCAPLAGRGKLQLAVITPRPIIPTELVVDHFRKDEVLCVGSAPKEVELWIEIKDDSDGDGDAENLREDIRHRIRAIYPDIFSRTYTQKDRLLDPKLALGPEWVPVGRWIYQISSHENVQYFGIPLDLASMGVVARQHVVRVNSNWGNVDRTCLVRVGLHGKDASIPNEYLEGDDY